MLKLNLAVLILSFLALTVSAQNFSENEYVGTLQLANKDTISVKINFRKASNGSIEGASVTNIYGIDRTQSKITGSVNAKNNSISFKEVSNISTISTANTNEFCFIEVNNATIKKSKGKTIITGSFVGRYSNGQKCASGTLYLINTSYSDKITLQAQEVLNLNWTSNDIIIEVWDGDQEDQDEIGIFLDDQKILDQFVLKQQKKTIVVPFTSQVSVLKIIGLDEGASYPCTANVILRDGNNTTSIVAILKKGETTSVKLTKIK